ncbi:signal peptidase I [Georgenia yuyongxinii]|uniref:Signal peptidase I n=1 Tax=Georgenia yuyongxinii TaxID=2589797 RepID=A0A552WM23_9MICO|nr:signal peptidase I [Georgenia yuyongxinii]TRW43821.1 signal peptidase I [Georgenia yuyongxinii]
MTTARELARGAATALTWLALAVVVGVLTAMVLVPRVAGWVPLTVMSGSMAPGIPAGSQLVVDPVDSDDLAALATGDVITFMPFPDDPTLLTHRIVGIGVNGDGERSFVTQGDANDVADPDPVTAPQVRGVLKYHVPFVGHLATALSLEQKDVGRNVAAGVLAIFAAWQLVSALRPRPRPRAEAHAAQM